MPASEKPSIQEAPSDLQQQDALAMLLIGWFFIIMAALVAVGLLVGTASTAGRAMNVGAAAALLLMGAGFVSGGRRIRRRRRRGEAD